MTTAIPYSVVDAILSGRVHKKPKPPFTDETAQAMTAALAAALRARHDRYVVPLTDWNRAPRQRWLWEADNALRFIDETFEPRQLARALARLTHDERLPFDIHAMPHWQVVVAKITRLRRG